MISLSLMTLFSCSATVVIKSKLIIPPPDLMELCLHTNFAGNTTRDLALHAIYLENELEKCNLKQEKELEWFKTMQERLDNENK